MKDVWLNIINRVVCYVMCGINIHYFNQWFVQPLFPIVPTISIWQGVGLYFIAEFISVCKAQYQDLTGNANSKKILTTMTNNFAKKGQQMDEEDKNFLQKNQVEMRMFFFVKALGLVCVFIIGLVIYLIGRIF